MHPNKRHLWIDKRKYQRKTFYNQFCMNLHNKLLQNKDFPSLLFHQIEQNLNCFLSEFRFESLVRFWQIRTEKHKRNIMIEKLKTEKKGFFSLLIP